MRYLALIYEDPNRAPEPGDLDPDGVMKAYYEVTAAMQEAGVLLHGEPLQGTDTATTVRVRGPETLTVDGPFAETKEILTGYYAIDCKDLDEALAWAARIPGAWTGSVEVRPIWELPGMG